LTKVILHKKDETWVHLECDERSVHVALREEFSFLVDGYRFNPQYINGNWDGRIRMYDSSKRRYLAGLTNKVYTFLCQEGHDVELVGFERQPFDPKHFVEFVKSLNLPFQPAKHQWKAMLNALRDNRGLYLAATGAGKSFVIYLIFRYLQSLSYDKILLIVPTRGLVEQMYSDFADYSKECDWDVKENCHKVEGTRDTDKQITISTWQSAIREDPDYFEQFNTVLVDEAHLSKAKSITTIMNLSTNAKYKIGVTGTIEDTVTNILTLEGLFGPIKTIVTAKELIDIGFLARVDIEFVELVYEEDFRKQVRTKHSKYMDEIQALLLHSGRLDEVCRIAAEQEEGSNGVVMFRYEKHGKALFNRFQELYPDIKCHFINGTVKPKERERIRQEVDNSKGNVIFASFNTTATGTNIKNLNWSIIASPLKSKITTIQALGRILRKSDTKDYALALDLADDLRIGKYKNYAYGHAVARLEHYKKEKHYVRASRRAIANITLDL